MSVELYLEAYKDLGTWRRGMGEKTKIFLKDPAARDWLLEKLNSENFEDTVESVAALLLSSSEGVKAMKRAVGAEDVSGLVKEVFSGALEDENEGFG